jgi:hypothetical protein
MTDLGTLGGSGSIAMAVNRLGRSLVMLIPRPTSRMLSYTPVGR